MDESERQEVPMLEEWLGPDEPGLLDNLEDTVSQYGGVRLEILELIRDDFRHIVGARKSLKWAAFLLVVVWLAFVGYILVCNNSIYKLEPSVLIALLSSGSAQVLGLFLVIAAHVFPRKGPTLSPELLIALDEPGKRLQ